MSYEETAFDRKASFVVRLVVLGGAFLSQTFLRFGASASSLIAIERDADQSAAPAFGCTLSLYQTNGSILIPRTERIRQFASLR